MAVGEIFLSAFISVLFNKLASPEFFNFVRQEALHGKLAKLKKTLLKVQAALSDAEKNQVMDSAVKLWLEDLRDLAYDMDDLLDALATEAMRCKLMADGSQATTSTTAVRSLIPACFTACLNPSTGLFNVRMSSKIEEITNRMQETATQVRDLGLLRNAGGRSKARETVLTASSLVDAPHVNGRYCDERAIVIRLLNDEASENEIGVIPIIGLPGVGKTTLAQLAFNNKKVEKKFYPRVWLSVTYDFDVARVTKTILQSITPDFDDVDNLNLLQVSLKKKLAGKKFLLVLDDIWNEDYDTRTRFRTPLKACAAGSKLIVTTRSQRVVSIIGGPLSSPHTLRELSDADCLSILFHHALETRELSIDPAMQEIGEKIVRKCKGLPLAAKALGGMLRTKLNRDEWAEILNSNIWDLPEIIPPALRLSYHHLPPHLKPCFTYCSVFPKGYEFDKDELVLLWMAEGLLEQPSGEKEMEDLGREYFCELLSRSLFQPSSSNVSKFIMHDLINALAQSVAAEICFNLDDQLENNVPHAISEKVRHSSFTRHIYEIFKKFEPFHKAKYLRTFLALPIHASYKNSGCYISTKVLSDLLMKMRCLRVLSLSGYWIFELPNSIGDLKHLRYLNFSHTSIELLPESISNLYNLQTLIIRGCWWLSKLPTGIENLVHLRHLDLVDTPNLQKMPSQIGKLRSLQTLSKFNVGEGSGLRIQELKILCQLRGQLSIIGLHNITDIKEVADANLKSKHKIEDLTMKWSGNFHVADDDSVVFELLEPCENLRKLTIASYGGLKFPFWMGDPSFSSMVELNLNNCRKCRRLPSLGRLSSLKVLQISGMNEVRRVDDVFYGEVSTSFRPFPALESLTFEDMPNWEFWFPISNRDAEVLQTIFPCLVELNIWKCPKLSIELIHPCLPSIEKLSVRGCPHVLLHFKFPFIRELNVTDMIGWGRGLHIDLHSLTALTKLTVGGIPELSRIGEWLPLELEHLEIINCANLEELPNGLHRLKSLKNLIIGNCPRLVSFPETGLPPMLRVLALDGCEGLKLLPDGRNNSSLHFLERLEVRNCPSLVCFPDALPSTLIQLEIEGCINLKALPDGIMQSSASSSTTTTTRGISHLEVLDIRGCQSLKTIPTGNFPSSLKQLEIWNCEVLEPISEQMLCNNAELQYLRMWNYPNLRILEGCLDSLANLNKLEIVDCPGLEFFPKSGLSNANLKELWIENCENLGSLPRQMQNLTSLQKLHVRHCPSLLSLPEGGLAPNLTSLRIEDCQNLQTHLFDWGLHRLTSLKAFRISGACPDVVSLRENDRLLLLPRNLTWLSINKLQNLESLAFLRLQNLDSLEELLISDCPKLRSFLPDEGLPATLSRLEISRCPILGKRCLKGEDWPKIAHIPCVRIFC